MAWAAASQHGTGNFGCSRRNSTQVRSAKSAEFLGETVQLQVLNHSVFCLSVFNRDISLWSMALVEYVTRSHSGRQSCREVYQEWCSGCCRSTTLKWQTASSVCSTDLKRKCHTRDQMKALARIIQTNNWFCDFQKKVNINVFSPMLLCWCM